MCWGEEPEFFSVPSRPLKAIFPVRNQIRTMNKHDLIKAIAVTSGLRAVDILKAMGAFENILVDCMARGERLFWSGIGPFSVREHKARSGRSPFTGLKIRIPARKVVKFSPGKSLREAAMKK